jgi:hypothetical protein
MYQNGLNTLRVMARGSLISLIHDRTLEKRKDAYDDSTAVGLVTADVAAIENAAQMFHDTWRYLAEVSTGTFLPPLDTPVTPPPDRDTIGQQHHKRSEHQHHPSNPPPSALLHHRHAGSLLLPDTTLRFKLDSPGVLTDEVIITVLEKTGVWKHLLGSLSDQASDAVLADTEDHAVLETPLLSLPYVRRPDSAPCFRESCSTADGTRRIRRFPAKPIILLEEITSSLDAGTEEKVDDIVEKFVRKGHTVIMVTHKINDFASRLRPHDTVV